MGGDGRVMKDGGDWEVTELKYHLPSTEGTKITLCLLHGSRLIRLYLHPEKFPGWERISYFQVYLFPSLDEIMAPKHAGVCCSVRLSSGHEST